MSMDKDLETIAEIDRVVHSPTRLMILAYLGAVDSALNAQAALPSTKRYLMFVPPPA